MSGKVSIRAFAMFLGSCLSAPLALAQVTAPSGYQLAWQDEFSGAALNTQLWTAANTNIPTNNSLQDYLPQQVSVAGGLLKITSQNTPSRGLPYRSGLITSKTLQKYGRWEIRANLPTTTGMWPAIWLLADAPWPSQGEIDIMENRGNEPTKTSSAFHYGTNPPYQHSYVFAEQTTLLNGQPVNYHSGFHNYAVEWDPKQIRFYVDDVHFWTVRDNDVNGFLTNSVGPMRLIINTAIGGTFLENPNQTTVWPQVLEVDYVRAFNRLETGPTLMFENGGFESQNGSMAGWTTFGNSINNVSTSQNFKSEGDTSLKLYGQFNGQTNYSGVEQGMTVATGQQLTASADAWISAADSIAGSGNRVELKIDYYRAAYGQYGTSDYISSDQIVLANGTSANNAWLTGQVTSTVPANAVEARLSLVFRQQSNAPGAVYVDNVQFAIAPVPFEICAGHVFHSGWTGPITSRWDAINYAKILAEPGPVPTALGIDHVVNTAQGIDGIVLDIVGLEASDQADWEYTWSPQEVFDPIQNSPSNWLAAPQATVTKYANEGIQGSHRYLLQWPSETIVNRWLQIKVTKGSQTATRMIGHLRGETAGGAVGGVFSVSYAAELAPIRVALATNVDASSLLDIDKNGAVQFLDIIAMRTNVGKQLTQITIP